MIAVSCFKGRKIALFGLGGSGLAAAAACASGGADIYVWDDHAPAVEQAKRQGLKTQDLRHIDWDGFAALILSPGVPLTHPIPHWSVRLARQAGVEIIGDMELFARARAQFLAEQKKSGAAGIKSGTEFCPVIAVTGTNGKSTTTALIAHILRQAGFDAQMGGNIGKPVLELAAFKSSAKQVYVLEISSYQIDLAPSLKPTVSVLLNITPDHIDRHGSFKKYAAVKERLTRRGKTAIIGCGDAPCSAVYEKLLKAEKSVTAVRQTAQGYETVPPRFSYKSREFFNKDGEILHAAPVLYSRHNAQNTLCALAACAALGAGEFEKGLESFNGLPHRMEDAGSFVYKGVKIRFINDSKATNAEAVSPALQSFGNIYWLAGGRPKAGGINSLMTQEHMEHIKGCYFFGEAAADFEKTARNYLREFAGMRLPQRMENMGEALQEALKNMRKDADRGKIHEEAVILLSPACAGFDQFKNFEERGKAFAVLAAQAIKEAETHNKECKG